MGHQAGILLLVVMAHSQVNFDFGHEEDLLATDSQLSNEIRDFPRLRKVAPPPPSFRKIAKAPSSFRKIAPAVRKIAPPPPTFRKVGDRLLAKKPKRVGFGGASRVVSERGEGGYTFSYQTEDGQRREERGQVE